MTSATSEGCALLGIAVFLSSGCAEYPKMIDGPKLEVERGYWLRPIKFSQDGHQVDRRSAIEVLSKHEESAPSVSRAKVFGGAELVTSLTGLVLLSVATVRAFDGKKITEGTQLGLYLGTAGCIGLGVAFRFGAEGAYVSAARSYNGE